MTCFTACLAVTLAVADETTKDDEAKRALKDESAIEILKQVDKATRNVKAVRYNGTFTASGFGAAHLPTVTGTAILRGSLEDRFEYHFDVNLTHDEIDGSHRMTAGGNGSTYFFIDWQRKIAHEGEDERIIGAGGQKAKWFLTMIEFIHPNPFTHEIEGNRIELKDEALVGDVECYVIHVVYGINGQEATWYFGKEDYLPRRVIRSYPVMDGQRVVRDRSVLDLEIDPELPAALFELQLPDGFQKTNDPAPRLPIPR